MAIIVEHGSSEVREKAPTKAQDYVLKIGEVLTQIEKAIRPILIDNPMKEQAGQSPATSQLLLSLEEVLEEAEALRDRIDI